MASCASCGTENAADGRFCHSCGRPLEPVARLGADGSEETRKVVTVVFCDVTGSTALGEQLDAETLRRVLASYFKVMQRVIERHGGTVEKFTGDAGAAGVCGTACPRDATAPAREAA